MSGWHILALVLIILFLIGQIRIGAEVRYGQDGAQVQARAGIFRITLFPRKPAEQKKKPSKSEKKTTKVKSVQKQSGKDKKDGKKLTVDQICDLAKQFVPLVLEAAGCLWSKLVMDILEISIVIGGNDPADAALSYGQVNAALGAVWKPLNEAFHVRNGRGHVEVDFDNPDTTLYVHAALSIKIGQVLWLGIYFGVKALKRFLEFRKIQKAKQQERKAV
jgi:hypothetical protein